MFTAAGNRTPGNSEAELNEFDDKRQTQIRMKDDIAALANRIDECRELLWNVDNKFNRHFSRKIEATAELVTDAAEKMKRAIDDYKLQLMNELDAARKHHEEKVACMRQELRANLLVFETFKHIYEQSENDGVACDGTPPAALHARTVELLRHKVSAGSELECLKDIKFSSEFSIQQLHRLFGRLDIIDDSRRPAENAESDAMIFPRPAELIRILPSTNNEVVAGITSLGGQVFVVRKQAPNIDVYDAVTLQPYTPDRSLDLSPYVGYQSSLAACDRNKCVYASICQPRHVICRFNPSLCNNSTARWSTAPMPTGISVDRNAHLLVACSHARKIQEFEHDGTLVREILLQPDVTFPMFVVQLSGDLYGVTHVGAQHRFCVVGADGRVVRSFGGPPGSGDGRLKLPRGIALGARGDAVFVADKENNRILLLNLATFDATQPCVHTLRLAGRRLELPHCVHYDRSRGLLYIGQHGHKRQVLVVAIAT